MLKSSMTIKLICLDMDGVIFKDTNFWMNVHEVFGTLEQGKILTKQYLHTDYQRLVEEVVHKLWKGKDATPYIDLVNSIEYMQGVSQLMHYVKEQGWVTAIVSASSIDVARRVQRDYSIDHLFANELVIQENTVTGEFLWPIGVGGESKARIVQQLCKDLSIKPQEVVYLGDSTNDIEAFEYVGNTIAFNPLDDRLRELATYVVESKNIADVMPVLKELVLAQ